LAQTECWNIPSTVHHRHHHLYHHHHHHHHHVTGILNPSHINVFPKNVYSYFSLF
jgi:hypothetical protein